jgi:PAS domain S-box-containing protein
MAGQASFKQDLPLVMNRRGFEEQTWFTFSYSPVWDESGAVAGLFCTCTETTGQVLAERRREFRIGLEERLRALADPRAVIAAASQALGEHLGAGSVGYGEVDPSGEFVTVEHDWVGPGGVSVVGPRRFEDYGAAMGAEMRAGRTVRVDDVARSPLTAAAVGSYAALNARALLNVPLVKAGRIAALVFVLGGRERAWTDDEVAIVEEAAERTWAAVQRARAEAALRESEDHHRHTVELHPQVSWTSRPDGQLDHVARRWFDWTGTSGLGESWGAAMYPEDLQPTIEAWTRSVTTGVPYDIEHRVRLTSGAVRWMRSRAFPRRDPEGRIVKWYGTTEDIHEARLADDRLRESETRFRNMADHAPVMMWVTDPTGACTYLNRRWYEFTGQSEAEAQGFGWLDATHPDDKAEAERAFIEANAAGAPFRVEYRLRRADGAYRWAIDAASPRFAPDGAFLGYVGSVIDIDERREAEERLRDSERRARELAAQQAATLGQLAEGVVVTNAAGRIVLVNEAAARIHGVSRLEIGPDEYSETYRLLTEDGRPYPSLDLPLARAVRGETVLDARWRIRRSDGREVLAVGNARPVLDATGRQIGAVLTLRDDTARVEAERSLRESEARLRALTDNLPSGMVYQITTGRDGSERRFLYVSQSHERLTGLPAEAVLADPSLPYNLILPEHQPAVVEAEAAAIRTRTPFDVEVRFRRADTGEVRWSRIISAPREMPDGSLIWDGIQIDTTEQKEAETALRELNATLEQRVAERTAELEEAHDALRQAQKMEAVGQLTGGIAHDFNNLLTGIVGSLDLMQTRLSQGRTEAIERYAKAAMSSAQRAAALTHRLLAFSRRQPLDPRAVNANQLITSMEDLLRRTIGPMHALEFVTAGGLWTTLCDPNQLESAILNLAINARDAMPEGGKLTIETANSHLDDAYAAASRDVTPGQYVAICITDTGTGMTPDVISRAFEPFFTTKPLGQGTGLGLSMVYGFTKQSEGHLKIYSEVGQGTTVKIYLPRHRGEAVVDEAQEDAAEAPRAGPGETVLVVEDEPVIRDLIVEVLQDLGYRALEASDGPSGLRILQSRRRIDLLVTDVGLPGLNGRQLADQARERRPDLKVLFITGYAENATLANGFLDPGMEMITKPFAVDALATKIKAMIRGG